MIFFFLAVNNLFICRIYSLLFLCVLFRLFCSSFTFFLQFLFVFPPPLKMNMTERKILWPFTCLFLYTNKEQILLQISQTQSLSLCFCLSHTVYLKYSPKMLTVTSLYPGSLQYCFIINLINCKVNFYPLSNSTTQILLPSLLNENVRHVRFSPMHFLQVQPPTHSRRRAATLTQM